MGNRTNERIKRELMLRGASLSQAETYLDLLAKFEGPGDSHHILPAHCGWWKKYDNARWNRIQVPVALHISLHAYLFFIFPNNRGIVAGLKAVAIRQSSLEQKRAALKPQMIHWLTVEKRSFAWIGRRIGHGNSTVRMWFRAWGFTRHISEVMKNEWAQRETSHSNKFKKQMVSAFLERQSLQRIAASVNLHPRTVSSRLARWGYRRSKSESILISYLEGRKRPTRRFL